VEATTGFEPVNRGFADPRSTIIGSMDEPEQGSSDGAKTNGSGVRSGVSTLYRYFDESDRLLYVGITGAGRQRGSGHARQASWWPYVAKAEFMHATLAEVRLAERLAIWTERPLYNVWGRVSTATRQAMRAKLAEVPSRYVTVRLAMEVLGLDYDDLRAAVHMGFIETEQGRLTRAGLEAFIGEADGERSTGLPPFFGPRRLAR
jgi:hypothetical protein